MEKPKNIRKRLATAGLGLAGALLLAGCTSQQEEVAPEVTELITNGNEKRSPVVSTEYFPNGTRNVLIDQEDDGMLDVVITAYCEGGDLVEISAIGFRGVGNDRQVGHIACADNRLTPEDFLPLPQ